jgi:CrcB protein
MSTSTILAIGLGGFLGAILRAVVVHFTNKSIISDFPYGILTVNVLGSFTIGCLFAYFAMSAVSGVTKSFLTTGLLGAFTTYSTFAIESFFLLQTSFFLGVMNMILNLFGSVVAAGLGYKLIHFFLRNTLS